MYIPHVTGFVRHFMKLPDKLSNRFVKIRYYGLSGNRYRKGDIALCRIALGVTEEVTHTAETWQELLLAVTGIDISWYVLSVWEDEKKRGYSVTTV
jgi:hypothetical protein